MLALINTQGWDNDFTRWLGRIGRWLATGWTRLFLDNGRANGAQVIPAEWANPASLPGVQTLDRYMHRHLWWFPEGSEGDYYAYGHNGQYIYVNPAARTVIVKFSETNRQDPVGMFRAVAASLKPEARVAELDRLAAPAIASR